MSIYQSSHELDVQPTMKFFSRWTSHPAISAPLLRAIQPQDFKILINAIGQKKYCRTKENIMLQETAILIN